MSPSVMPSTAHVNPTENECQSKANNAIPKTLPAKCLTDRQKRILLSNSLQISLVFNLLWKHTIWSHSVLYLLKSTLFTTD